MDTKAHLWAIGYDTMEQADQLRDRISELGWGNGRAGTYLFLLEIAVVVRHLDGTFALNRKPFPNVVNIATCTTVGFLVGLVVAAPLTGAAIGALVGVAGTASAHAAQCGISEDFIRQVEELMKPGTSALFVLDTVGDMSTILDWLRGMGGTILKSNVDPERAKLIQSTLVESTKAFQPNES